MKSSDLRKISCVYIHMRNWTAAEQARLGYLRAAYEDALRGMTSQVSLWLSLAREPTEDPRAIEEARKRAEEALSAYRYSRDQLAQFLLERMPNAGTPKRDGNGEYRADRKSQIEFVAYQFWESEGRPSGRAEADWYRAERLVLNDASMAAGRGH